ncbi:hypothetical protein C8J57DRAFT_1334905 [Mycena rebaudengoi]|nr:hypothetical protein C8J57DRAFT_1334905 [Mycena rebaudengoi]
MHGYSPPTSDRETGASTIISNLAEGQLMENLHMYHSCQMKLLTEIAINVQKRIGVIVAGTRKGSFIGTVETTLVHLTQLNRMLGGGSLAAWFQAEDSEDALGVIEWKLSSYEDSDDNTRFKERINEAIKTDRETTRKKVAKKTRQFELRRKQDFLSRFRSPSPKSLDETLRKLLPPIKSESSLEERKIMYRNFLQKFLTQPPSNPTNLASLVVSMQEYFNAHNVNRVSIPLHVLRKPSGHIVTIIPHLVGVEEQNQILDHYCPELINNEEKNNKAQLPRLYTAGKHRDLPDELDAAKIYCDHPTAMKLVPWTGGCDESYLVETFMQKIFVFATVLGGNEQVIVTFPHTLSADPNWNNIHREYEKQCSTLERYGHQLIVPGWKKTKCPNLSGISKLEFTDL